MHKISRKVWHARYRHCSSLEVSD